MITRQNLRLEKKDKKLRKKNVKDRTRIGTAQRTDKGAFQEKECGVQHQDYSEIMLKILNYVIKCSVMAVISKEQWKWRATSGWLRNELQFMR